MSATIGIVLAGGGGTRLWPLSRLGSPKQFLQVNNASLLSQAVLRAASISSGEKPVVLTSRELEAETHAHLALMGIADTCRVVAEPATCDTAFSMIYSALRVQEAYGEDSVMVFLPSDHLVDEDAFSEALGTAVDAARNRDSLIILGVNPTDPAEAYGYVMHDEVRADGSALVSGFVEKPTHRRAVAFIEAGAVWNAGVVVVKPRVLLDGLKSEEALTLLESAKRVIADPQAVIACNFPQISFDRAVLEQAESIRIVPVSGSWNDMGSFRAYERTIHADSAGNRMEDEGLLARTTQTTVISRTDRVIVGLGLEDTVIVDTPDALLVAGRPHLDHLRRTIAQLGAMNSPVIEAALSEPLIHQRPWGIWQLLSRGQDHWVKRIEVSPGKRLSEQSHEHRSEHWTVIRGTALVRVNGVERALAAGESLDVSPGVSHRLSNPGPDTLVVIETARGQILSEEDITRYEDDWSRPE